jgi:hypothetical protein
LALLLAMSDFQEKSFEFANEAMKLVLTLATGVVAFTVTFTKDMIGSNPIQYQNLLIASWVLMILSATLCLLTLLAIAGTAYKLSLNNSNSHSIYDTNIKLPSAVAISTFILGMICMVTFTLKNFPSQEKKVKIEVPKPKTELKTPPKLPVQKDSVDQNKRITSTKILSVT